MNRALLFLPFRLLLLVVLLTWLITMYVLRLGIDAGFAAMLFVVRSFREHMVYRAQ